MPCAYNPKTSVVRLYNLNEHYLYSQEPWAINTLAVFGSSRHGQIGLGSLAINYSYSATKLNLFMEAFDMLDLQATVGDDWEIDFRNVTISFQSPVCTSFIGSLNTYVLWPN